MGNLAIKLCIYVCHEWYLALAPNNNNTKIFVRFDNKSNLLDSPILYYSLFPVARRDSTDLLFHRGSHWHNHDFDNFWTSLQLQKKNNAIINQLFAFLNLVFGQAPNSSRNNVKDDVLHIIPVDLTLY